MIKWILLLSVGFSLQLQAQSNYVDRVVDLNSTEQNPLAARKEILDKSIEKASLELIREMIGDTKLNKNLSLIQARIIKNSAKYVPLTKTSDLKNLSGGGYSMSVTVKMNPDDLQSMLIQQGLLSNLDSQPTVIPFVHWSDRLQGTSHGWWYTEGESKLAVWSKLFERKLRKAFFKTNFYFVKAEEANYRELLPTELQKSVFLTREAQEVQKQLGLHVLLTGLVELNKSPNKSDQNTIYFRIQAIQVSNGRLLAEVSRKNEIQTRIYESSVEKNLNEMMDAIATDLATQLSDVWLKGSFGSTLSKVTVRGGLNLMEQETFKEAIKNKVREIKMIRERLITSDAVTYEIDSVLTPQQIGEKMQGLEFGETKYVFDGSDEHELVIKTVKATR